MQHLSLRLLPLLLLACLPAFGTAWQYDGVGRVVAIADVHGAYGAMRQTLANAEVIDSEGNWAAGTSHLVICGDILDRGPESRAAMDLLMALEAQAEAAGGKVHVLIGNHEAMNLVGDLRYVAKEEYQAFAAEETQELRDRWFAAWSTRQAPESDDAEALRARFDERFPAGYFSHRAAFQSDGYYGQWLLSKPVVVVINKTAFVHGGLSPMIAKIGLDGVNGRLVDEMRRYLEHKETLIAKGVLLPTDNFYNHPKIIDGFLPSPTTDDATLAAVEGIRALNGSAIHASDGPLWYRGNVHCTRLIEEARLDRSLAAIGAERVVIGHTPTPNRRVLERLGGRVIEIDTGMLNDYYAGRGHALVLEGEAVRVVPEIDGSQSEPLPHPRRVGERKGGALSAEALEALLATGEVGPVSEDEAGRQIVTVTDGKRTVDALFVKRAGRGFYPDVAAYKLDRLIDLDQVPVAVVREVDGKDGSLQFLPAQWTDEQVRSESGRGGSATCPLQDQWSAMYLYDSLIFNEGRLLARMLYSIDNWQLVLVGHGNAFSTRKGRPRHLENIALEVNPTWRSELEALEPTVLEAALDGVLDKRRRRALLARRDELLAR